MSITISYSEIRQKLKAYIDKACLNSEAIIIKRKNGDNAVIISEEEYNSLDETAYLLRSPKNRKILRESLDSNHDIEFSSIEDLKNENNI